MTLDQQTRRRMKILRFFQEKGGSCSNKGWEEFDNKGPGPQLAIDMETDLIPSGHVKHVKDDQSKERYILTEEGKQELENLESLKDDSD